MVRIVATLGWSAQVYQDERQRSIIGMSSLDDCINGVMNACFAPMDPNALLCQMHKWQDANVVRHAGGDLAAALVRITAKAMVIPISHDPFFPPHECEADSRLVPCGLFRLIQSPEGDMGQHQLT